MPPPPPRQKAARAWWLLAVSDASWCCGSAAPAGIGSKGWRVLPEVREVQRPSSSCSCAACSRECPGDGNTCLCCWTILSSTTPRIFSYGTARASWGPWTGTGRCWRIAVVLLAPGNAYWNGLGPHFCFLAFSGHVHPGRRVCSADTHASEGSGRPVQRSSSICSLAALMEALGSSTRVLLARSTRGAETFLMLLLHSLLQSALEMVIQRNQLHSKVL